MDLFDRARVQELESLILRYQDSYYNGEAEVSDAEFDALWDELKSLDPQNAILHRVGADSGTFAKARHVMPMGSQEKAANEAEFLAWAKKHDYPEYLVEYKLDGASLELQYSAGQLQRAVTRGDGSVGDDITANARKMGGVPPVLVGKDGGRVDFTGGIRGEVIMTHDVHDRLFSDKANCRNAANGLMKRKDGEGSEHLTVIAYDVWSTTGDQPFLDEEDKIRWLAFCGFAAVSLHIAHSAQEVVQYRERVMQERPTLAYDIDGLVVKERAVNHEDALRDRPDRQIAFKFELESADTIIRSVEWSQAGATYTPVATFDAVPLNGTTVQKASLVNPNNIRALGVQIGSTVTVVKGGEIIPKIIAVRQSPTSCTPIAMPHACATCGTPLCDEGTRLYCPNKDCPERVLHQLLKWNAVVDIRGLGETLMRSLFSDGTVRSITDIYALTEQVLTPYFLTQKSRDADKKSLGAAKLYQSIQAKRSMSLVTFVAGFDIEGVGEAVVQLLVSAGYTTLEQLFALTTEQVAAVRGFADIMAKTFVQGLAENRAEMEALVASGTIGLLAEQPAAGGALSGKSFCFTGELVSLKRAQAQDIVRQNGGTVKSSVTKDLSYLVTNDTSSGSSKNAKAAQLGIPVISEREFLAMLP